jgi:hypothetical protein
MKSLMHNIFLTGCDKHTEWQLPWFIENYRKHNTNPIVLADFGMEPSTRTKMESEFDLVIDVKSEAKGWFKKPRAILDATKLDAVEKVCWIDTDCEITDNIETIFDLTEKGKLGMVKDRPWSTRRNELGEWYNSGVVAVEGTPNILRAWADECVRNPVQGDQEVLYLMMDGDALKKLSCIIPIPYTYNTLRLDYIDGINVKNPKIIHHTGAKGKETIKEQMNALFT